MTFRLDARLAADSAVVGDLPLCRLLLSRDSRYPWCILVPRQADLRELHQLSEAAGGMLFDEIRQVSHALEALFQPDKLNVAALGNLVPQPHVHVVARFRNDFAWPGPIWGQGEALPYEAAVLRLRVEDLQARLGL